LAKRWGDGANRRLRAAMLSTTDYTFLADFLRRRSGLSITSEKVHLIESRLKPVALRLGFQNASDLIHRLKSGDEATSRVVTEAMTTNETSFFRDKVPFDQFRDMMLPALSSSRREETRLRIWCSAASSGQEPYSLAMIIDAASYLKSWDIEVVASDISSEMIERAAEGLFSQFEVLRGLPIQMLARHFHHEGGEWRLSSAIRSRVRFEVANLLEPFESLGQFDAIFCRNVLMYFDQETKHNILGRLAQVLASDGYLVLGSAETVLGSGKEFEPIVNARGIYVKSGFQPPRAAVG
jgi:chemotaxis protein methyltransferase CheR